MFIRKYQQKKDALRITREEDIPENLKDTIWFVDKDKEPMVAMLSAEGIQYVSPGAVIGFELFSPTETGKCAWPLGSDSYTERNGIFYSVPDVRQADRIHYPYTLQTETTTMKLQEGKDGYLITKENGEQYILSDDTVSLNQYTVCTKDGTIISPLNGIVTWPTDKLVHSVEEMMQKDFLCKHPDKHDVSFRNYKDTTGLDSLVAIIQDYPDTPKCIAVFADQNNRYSMEYVPDLRPYAVLAQLEAQGLFRMPSREEIEANKNTPIEFATKYLNDLASLGDKKNITIQDIENANNRKENIARASFNMQKENPFLL